MIRSMFIAVAMLISAASLAQAELPACVKVSHDVAKVVSTPVGYVPVYSCRVEING